MKQRIFVITRKGNDRARQRTKMSCILQLFCMQAGVTAGYVTFFMILSLYLNAASKDTNGMSLILYFCYISVLAVMSAVSINNGVLNIYTPQDKCAIFLLHLLIMSLFLLLEGCRNGDTVVVSWAYLSFVLYLGFSVSLTQVLGVKNFKDFLYCFVETYRSAQLSHLDYSLTIGMDLLFGLILYFRENTWVMITFYVSLALLLVGAFLLRQSIKKQENVLLHYIESAPNGKRILIYKLGSEPILYPRIETEFSISEIGMRNNWEEISRLDYVVVLNTILKKREYIRYLSELLQILPPEIKIIDPSISKKKAKRSFWFLWFSLPEEIKELTYLEYINLVDSWR